MNAIAIRPLAASIPIAGKSALRPRVTAVFALHVTPSGELETKTAFREAPGASQSCHVTQARPVASTAAAGSGNARKPRIAHEPSTSAIRTGAPHVVPPSVDREAAIANRPVSHR